MSKLAFHPLKLSKANNKNSDPPKRLLFKKKNRLTIKERPMLMHNAACTPFIPNRASRKILVKRPPSKGWTGRRLMIVQNRLAYTVIVKASSHSEEACPWLRNILN